jgi:hypothetical protein
MRELPDFESDAVWAKPRAGVPITTASLIMAFSRVRMMRREWSRIVDAAMPHYTSESADRDVYTFTVYNWMCLWLACLEVVVEGFEHACEHDRGLCDMELAGQLASPFRQKLKGFRNKIFHPEPFNHPNVITVLERAPEFVLWAETITNAFERVLGQYLPPRANDGDTL